ncbi:MAG: hypothetical protein ACXVCY_07610 [Pseudobdellovibrionaceae bacterium]
MSYSVQASVEFLNNLEEAVDWLYSHNEQQSIEFANKKKAQFENEVNTLKDRLSTNPYSIGTEILAKVPAYRKISIYGGRYQAEWTINDSKKEVNLLRLKDLVYPAELRYKEFHLEDDED